jgi:hypothetical protein
MILYSFDCAVIACEGFVTIAQQNAPVLCFLFQYEVIGMEAMEILKILRHVYKGCIPNWKAANM